MARYIDADKLCEALKCMASVQCPDKQNTILGVVSSIENFPTADVVPRSEVEEIKAIIADHKASECEWEELYATSKTEVVKALNEVELLIITTKEMYKQQMEDAPSELSKQSKRTKWIAFEKFYEQFAELKKKYTEGDRNEDIL